MLKTLLNKIFSFNSNNQELEKLQEWITNLKWSELREFKISCHNSQVSEHFQALQSWHYEWSDHQENKFHLTVFQPSSHPQSLMIKGYKNDSLAFDSEQQLEEGPEETHKPFKKRVQTQSTTQTQRAKEVLSNLQQLNAEFAQFVLRDLIETAEPIKKKEESKDYRSDETRGLEWARVSYQLLGQAMSKALTNPEEMRQEWNLQWSRSPQEPDICEVRLLAFNLDTMITAQKSQPLDVSIYDHKNFKRPIHETSFMGQFQYGSGDFIELFSKLLKDIIH